MMTFLFPHFKKVLFVLIFAFSATMNSAYAIKMNLQDTTIYQLITLVSELTGTTFVVDPRVNNSSNVTLITNKDMDEDELYETFLSILEVHGNAVIKTGNITKIVPKTKALAETHPLVDLPNSQPAEKLITRLIPIKNVTALSIANSLRVVARNVKMQHHVESNSVLLSGRASDIERVNRLIQRMDRSNEKHIEVIPLKFADAESIVKTIQDLNKSSGGVGKLVGRGDKISANRRTNSLLISGDTATRQRIRAIVRRLDLPKKQEGSTKVVYLRYAKAIELVKVLQGLSKTSVVSNKDGKAKSVGESTGASNVDIQADESTNSLIITAEPAAYKNLYTVIKKLDVRRAQVMIETIIAEVGTSLSATLGMQFGFNGLDGKVGPVGISSFAGAGGNNLGSLVASQGTSLGTGALLGVGATFGGTQFVALLDALSSDGATNILSTPTLVTMDNEKAEIIVGQNVPLITGSFSGTGSGGSTPSNPFQTIERKDVGLSLRVTPQINEGTTVRLAIEQEISSLAASAAGASDLITNKRSVTTNVMVEDNDVLVLGGLFENTFRDSQEKVPVLSNIPFIGRLFRHDTTTKDHQNLMIFIHPVILRDNLTASAYSKEKYSAIRQRQQKSKILRRGALQHRANQFPDMNRIITKKPTSAELARRQREQHQRQQQQLARQRAAQQKRQQHQHRAPAPQPQQYRAPAAQAVDKESEHIPFIDDF